MPIAEQHVQAHRLIRDPEFQEIVRRKNFISTVLAIVMLAVYFGYMGLLAFAPGVLGAPAGRATLGIPIGIGVIIFAWILTGLYVRWANTKYDAMIAHLRTRVTHGEVSDEGISDKNISNEDSNS